jgi:hypothetical protein
MLIIIVGILSAALTSLSYIPRKRFQQDQPTTIVQNACGARGWTSLVDRVRHRGSGTASSKAIS